jgi:uncharacterized Zn finger protein
MSCIHCGEVRPVLHRNGPHVQALCPHCGRHIKFVSKADARRLEQFGLTTKSFAKE